MENPTTEEAGTDYVVEETETVEPEYTNKPEETPETPEETENPEETPEEAEERMYADKFKTVEDLENSYKELQASYSKKLGDFNGAPEAYELGDTSELSGQEVQMIENLQEWGTKNQLSQEGFESLVTEYTTWQDNQNQERLAYEYEQLGENADYRLQNVTDYLNQNVGKELTDHLAENMMSAKSIEAVEKLIALSKVPAPAAQVQVDTSPEKIEEMRFAVNEHGDRLMSIDPAYRARVLKLESQMK